METCWSVDARGTYFEGDREMMIYQIFVVSNDGLGDTMDSRNGVV